MKIITCIVLAALLSTVLCACSVSRNAEEPVKNTDPQIGSLPDPSKIPKANVDDVDAVKTLNYAEIIDNKQMGPDALGNDPIEDLTLVYVYNPATGIGRLGILDTLINPSISTMTIYEPEWKGIEGLVASLNSTFTAKVIYRVNLSYMEGEMYLQNTAFVTDTTDPDWIVDLENPTPNPKDGLQYYVVAVLYDHINKRLQPIGNGLSASATSLTNETRKYVFLRIVERFDLYDEFCIPK